MGLSQDTCFFGTRCKELLLLLFFWVLNLPINGIGEMDSTVDTFKERTKP